MSLLTPSESHAFQSFLSSIDYDYSIVESLVASADWTTLSDEIGVPVPHAGPAKEALAKATKDLITLPPAPPPSSSAWEGAELKDLAFFKPLRLPGPTFGSHPSLPQDVSKQRHDFDHLQGIVNNTQPSMHSRAPPSRFHRPSTSASSSSSSATNIAGPSRHPPSKRSLSEESSSSSASHKRIRPSPSRASASTPSQTLPGSKPALLSASQKKANHIQSEQKRRANIRRGYEALCETIPALREAIRAEEEASSGVGSGGKKRRARGRVGDDGEKIDGRAGPRSENIVLAKTVEYVQQLLAQRQHFIDRLQRARAMLPPGHPALGLARPPGEVSLWEREWSGGLDAKDDDDPGDASGDDDEP
ncbi:hypothetical protein EDB84DRAFT_1668451 [Lactarius hengduanensis]|nr:hypothetical protein EDB84DRAFT_1668451 [Lactarius hengduanensis]